MINALDQVTLNEIARMAWGSREGAAGGRGKIGVLVDANGKSRIIKYDTHLFSWSTADKNDESQLNAANNLRHQLLTIARNSGIEGEVLEEIRAKLGLDRTRGDWHGTDLLDRTVVAQVVAMIDGDIWEKAFADTDQHAYSTKDDTTSYATVAGEQDGERSANRTFHGANQVGQLRKHVAVAHTDVRSLTNQSLSDEEQKRVTTFLSDVMAEFLPNAERLNENDLSLVARSSVPFALIAIGRDEEAGKCVAHRAPFSMPKGIRLFSAINKALKKASPDESRHLPDNVCVFLDEFHARDRDGSENAKCRDRVFKLVADLCFSRLKQPLVISRLCAKRDELSRKYLNVAKDHMDKVDPRFDAELDEIQAKQAEVNGEIESANLRRSDFDDRLKEILDHVREGKPYSDIFLDIVA